MSETEMYRGLLKPVKTNDGETIEDVCKRIASGNGDNDLPTWAQDWQEFLYNTDDGYIAYGDVLYEVTFRKSSGDDIFEATKLPDGTIEYIVKYYNGGCDFYEAVAYALEKLDKSEGLDK